MKYIDKEKFSVWSRFDLHLISILFVGVSIAAIVAAFVLANSEYGFEIKIKGFSAIIVGFLIFCAILYTKVGVYLAVFGDGGQKYLSDDDLERKLFGIEEANTYFGGSLKSADMFRLTASRIKEIVPFDACVLFLIDSLHLKLRIVQSDGENARFIRGIQSEIDAGSVGKSIASGVIEIETGNTIGREIFSEEINTEFQSSAALPLVRNGEIFAVLQLFSKKQTAFIGDSITHLEAIRERVTPVIVRSQSFERSLSNALTDPLTELPNERAFFLVAENQIAEAQRNREGRSVSVLTIDIKYFNDVNEKYGHATGDRLLNFVAQKIKEQLRQMDFFTRASNDEFLVIMPTATAKVVGEIVERIETEFVGCRFSVNDRQSVRVDLNFGAATFWHDGETAPLLLATARERKEQSKTAIPNKVVWFPKEYVN